MMNDNEVKEVYRILSTDDVNYEKDFTEKEKV